MKAVDPSIQIGANGNDDGWWQTVLATASSAIDFLAVHEYPAFGWGSYSVLRQQRGGPARLRSNRRKRLAGLRRVRRSRAHQNCRHRDQLNGLDRQMAPREPSATPSSCSTASHSYNIAALSSARSGIRAGSATTRRRHRACSTSSTRTINCRRLAVPRPSGGSSSRISWSPRRAARGSRRKRNVHPPRASSPCS